jgi:hypothetical protein
LGAEALGGPDPSGRFVCGVLGQEGGVGSVVSTLATSTSARVMLVVPAVTISITASGLLVKRFDRLAFRSRSLKRRWSFGDL